MKVQEKQFEFKKTIHLPFTIVLNVHTDSLLHKRNTPIISLLIFIDNRKYK